MNNAVWLARLMLLAQRNALWLSLLVLVLVLLGTLIWLAGRYEVSVVQEKLERDASDAVQDIRSALGHHLQQISALPYDAPAGTSWREGSAHLLRERRELLRLEWRSNALGVLMAVESPYQPRLFGRISRAELQSDVAQLCTAARRAHDPVYSTSYFLPQNEGTGLEVMDLCLPLEGVGGGVSGFLVATYSLPGILSNLVGPQLTHGHEVSLTEPDGTRLAIFGALRPGSRTFTAQQIISLPGNTLVLRLDSRRTEQGLFPNVLTALVTLLSIALLTVVGMLGRDIRRRTLAERHLAHALVEQRRMEEISRASLERLQATARLATVGEMASLLSHELGQPLSAIASYASGSQNLLADSHSPLEAELNMAMGRIAQQAERAGKVISSVHNFVRRREGQREYAEPATLFDAVMPLVSLQASKLGVRVQTQLADDLPPVWCDRTMVEQVLLNLARNAMQAMEHIPLAERLLLLSIERLGPKLVFSVLDAGCGISPEVAQQLFQPFFTTKMEGMGLGLSLCRTVVEQHGGNLEFERRVPRGTIFRFTLPVVPPVSGSPKGLTAQGIIGG